MLRQLVRFRLPPALHLLGRIQPKVRMPGALVRQFADAEHLRFQPGADVVDQIRQRPIPRPLPRRPTRRPNPPQIPQVSLNDARKLLHPSPSAFPRILGHATPSPQPTRETPGLRPQPTASRAAAVRGLQLGTHACRM